MYITVLYKMYNNHFENYNPLALYHNILESTGKSMYMVNLVKLTWQKESYRSYQENCQIWYKNN